MRQPHARVKWMRSAMPIAAPIIVSQVRLKLADFLDPEEKLIGSRSRKSVISTMT